jgi:hypothetical protein
MATYEVSFRKLGSRSTSTVVVKAKDVAAAIERVEVKFAGSTVTGTRLLGR